MNRRQALVALVVWPGVLIALARTGHSFYHSAKEKSVKEKNCGTISDNHGHEVCLSTAQLTAGKSVSLTLTGRHSHSLTLGTDQVRAISAGQTAGPITSGVTFGHSHKVIFNA